MLLAVVCVAASDLESRSGPLERIAGRNQGIDCILTAELAVRVCTAPRPGLHHRKTRSRVDSGLIWTWHRLQRRMSKTPLPVSPGPASRCCGTFGELSTKRERRVGIDTSMPPPPGRTEMTPV